MRTTRQPNVKSIILNLGEKWFENVKETIKYIACESRDVRAVLFRAHRVKYLARQPNFATVWKLMVGIQIKQVMIGESTRDTHYCYPLDTTLQKNI